MLVNGKYYWRDELGLDDEKKPFNEWKLMQLYRTFNVQKPPRDRNGNLLHIFRLLNDINNDITAEEMCKNDR